MDYGAKNMLVVHESLRMSRKEYYFRTLEFIATEFLKLTIGLGNGLIINGVI